MTTGATIHTTAGLLMRLYERTSTPSHGMTHSTAPAHAPAAGGGCPMGFGGGAVEVAPAAAAGGGKA